MTDKSKENVETPDQAQDGNDNQPDWIVKAPRGQYKKSHLDRIGAAWNREDGGIGIRLCGKQLIEDDFYLYPNEPQQQ